MLPEELLNRINALAKKNKEQGLSDDEVVERDQLRQEYLKMIRGQVESQLSTIKVVDEEGKDVTPEKVKELKEKNKNKLN